MKKILVFGILFVGFLYADCSRDSSKEIVSCNDKFVGSLLWQDNKDTIKVKKSWSDANSYCSSLSLAGFDDWRLPSIEELLSITDLNRYNPAIKSVFKNAKSDYYWSSTANASVTSDAWYVGFHYGNADWSFKSKTNSVRCVR